MSYVVTVPELVVSAAADVENIGSAISTASATAAGPTTSLLSAAAADEVSAAIANLFAAYGREYHAIIGQAARFHDEFTGALAAAASSYAQTEAANAALGSGPSNALHAITSPIQTLLGHPPLSAGGSSGFGALGALTKVSAADPVIALIMGGTGTPQPDTAYLTAINTSYIQRLFPGASPVGLFAPEQFWPITPSLGHLTFGQSVARGVGLLNTALLGPTGVLTQGHSAVVFGYSQSATIATNEIVALMAAGSPHAGQLSFVLVGDPNNPVGGILERFPGFYIPLLDVAFNGATPPNSPYPSTIYTAQYDGIADAPQYPLDVLSDLNAVLGYFYVHGTYPLLTASQVGGAVALPTSPGYTGNTQYSMLLTQDLPLLDPIRQIPCLGNPIADLLQPDLRVLVDLGYASYGPGQNYANIPTPAGLLSVPNPFTVIPDLAVGALQGPQAALVDLGLLPQSDMPNIYPYVPSIDPQLNFFLGQPSTTGLSVLSDAVGDVLKLIPPVVW